jgi:hypothetical protein
VYGEPCTQDMHVMWELLKRLKPLSSAHWMIIGDFNEALWSFEHLSSRRRPEKQMVDFREVLTHCDVFDLGFSGVPWTYDNMQSGDRNVRVRLDRVVASLTWFDWFPGARVHHIVSARSDHLPILLDIEPDEGTRQSTRIAQYEIMWERENSLTGEIISAWNAGKQVFHLGDIAHNLKEVMKSLQRWSKEKFRAVTKELNQLKEKLESLYGRNHGEACEEIQMT